MKLFLDDLEIESSPLIDEIRAVTLQLHQHQLYSEVKTLNDIKTYMKFQVWCVWDFMALLKSLQRGLLVSDIEWTPPQDGSIGAYIYEILLTEETDITDTGFGHCSHFEIYLKAMKQAGADTNPIETFIINLKAGKGFEKSISSVEIPHAAREFVENTLKYAKSELHKSTAVFCLSREGIIPGMFNTFLENASIEKRLTTFLWYLRRHIEVDSDSHAPLSVKLFKTVVGNDEQKRSEALSAALDALYARRKFLDSIQKAISYNE